MEVVAATVVGVAVFTAVVGVVASTAVALRAVAASMGKTTAVLMAANEDRCTAVAAAVGRWDKVQWDEAHSQVAVRAEVGADHPMLATPRVVAWELPMASGTPLEPRAAQVDRHWPPMGDSRAGAATSAAVFAGLAVTVIAVSAMVAGEGAGAAVGVLVGDSAGALAGILSGLGHRTATACGGATTATYIPTLTRNYQSVLGRARL